VKTKDAISELSNFVIPGTYELPRRKSPLLAKDARNGAPTRANWGDLFRGGVGDVGVDRGQQIAGGFFVFSVGATSVEPVFEMFAGRGR